MAELVSQANENNFVAKDAVIETLLTKWIQHSECLAGDVGGEEFSNSLNKILYWCFFTT